MFVTTSKLLSSNGSCSASPTSNRIPFALRAPAERDRLGRKVHAGRMPRRTFGQQRDRSTAAAPTSRPAAVQFRAADAARTQPDRIRLNTSPDLVPRLVAVTQTDISVIEKNDASPMPDCSSRRVMSL